MKILTFSKIYYDFSKAERDALSAQGDAIVIFDFKGVARVFLVKDGKLRLEDTLGTFDNLSNAELFARGYADKITQRTFDDILRESFGFNKEVYDQEQYEIYSQQYREALKKYKELRPLDGMVKEDIAGIIVLANRFQRQLNKFIEKNTLFID